MSREDAKIVRRWLSQAVKGDVAEELEKIHVRVAGEIAVREPVCEMSGRCCNFEKFGHRLYVTGLETAYTVVRLERGLTAESLKRAVERGGCPFQDGLLCGVHSIRPVGCRVYFCDETAQEWMEDLAERAHGWVRALHESHGIDYRYGEWRAMLAMFLGDSTPEAEAQ